MNRIDSKGNVMIHVLKVKTSFEEIRIDFCKACAIIISSLIKRNKGRGVTEGQRFNNMTTKSLGIRRKDDQR